MSKELQILQLTADGKSQRMIAKIGQYSTNVDHMPEKQYFIQMKKLRKPEK